ncbi:MAG: MATE family efflux transporter [Clostridia bacterium]|nr:MATE family efflux transporter [Clostridia bacterium]
MIRAGTLRRGGRQEVNMTQGNIAGHLLRFAFPLLLGNIFQQLYNMVDTWVVGNYVSNEAFSAVGSVGPIINTLIGFFLGLSAGTGVVISQNYGAKRYDKVHDTVHTAFLMTLVLGVVFTAAGILMVPFALELMNTPEEVIPESTTYLTIYFAGVIGLMIYNIGAGILRAIGDSRRPFYYLVVSAIINTVLDLYFVLECSMGVEGVALATIIAQGVSALLVVLELLRTQTCVRLRFRDLKINREMLSKIFKVGLPSGIQFAITSFSNVFVQSYVNYFGPDCMSGWTAYAKVDQLILLPMQSLALASTTFVGQNLGVNNHERAHRGARTALFMSMGTMLVLMVPVMLFAGELTAFFNDEPAVVEYGTLLLRWLTPFYSLCCINQIYAGALRGAGDSRAPTVIMLCSFVLFRQAYLYVMANFICNEILPIAMGYPAGWLLCSIITLIYYKIKGFTGNSIADRAEKMA